MPRPPRHTWAVVLLTLLAGRYLLWRATSTLNLTSPAAAVLSLLTVAAEAMVITAAFPQLWFSLLPKPPWRARVEGAAAALAERIAASAPVPTVDVLVPSYGEPLALLERCLKGALAIDYPAFTVWLLDDSGRPELAALAERLGCRYLSRISRNHAKAGNLNHALQHTGAELVAVFDADVVPLVSFLRRTVGLFDDPRLGLVQTPQHYMSADPVMRNLHLERWLMPDEESFYRWIEPTRQALGAVICAGTSFVMRRSALEQVGGFETGTPSEDLATGIHLSAAGWQSFYLSDKLSAGLAPLSASAMARQRCRWAGGTLQVLRTGANPLTVPGLRLRQRLGFMEGILNWLVVLPLTLLVLVIPLLISITGVPPVRVGPAELLLVALPFHLTQLLLLPWLSLQSRTPLLGELYRWIFLLPLSGAVLASLAGRPQRFRVTAKSQGVATGGLEAGLALPLLLMLLLQALAVARLLGAPGAVGSIPSRLITLAWIGLTVLLLLLALRACWQRPADGSPPWFALSQPLELVAADGRRWPAQLRAISETGAELDQAAAAPTPLPDQPLHLALLCASGSGTVLLELGWRPEVSARSRRGRQRWGGGWWGPAGGALGPAERQHLEAFLYRRPGLWPTTAAPHEALALLQAVWRLLRPPRPEGWFDRSLIAQCPAVADQLEAEV
ncbi:MAG: cellulose synthase catalytic subunit [Cyanobacteriota bacterium]|nr:cellulose synthase catalytic subunit [Cyanobacteriota bacterium]